MIYGYTTGNGNHSILANADGSPDTTSVPYPIRYFRFPEEPSGTYRLFHSPDWIALPFGLIPTPDSHPGALPVQGSPGLFIWKKPRILSDTPVDAIEAEVVEPDKSGKQGSDITYEAIAVPVPEYEQDKPRRARRKKKDPAIVEVERLQLKQATTLFDVSGLNLEDIGQLNPREPFDRASIKKAVKAERKVQTGLSGQNTQNTRNTRNSMKAFLSKIFTAERLKDSE